MLTIVRKVLTGKCDRCGHIVLLDLVKDESGKQMLLCNQCTTRVGVEGLTDPLGKIKW
jgi:transcription elongation factor Elf1